MHATVLPSKPLALRMRRCKGLVYIAPWIVGVLVFQLYPFVYSFILSFTDKSMAARSDFVGLNNYVYMFTRDRDFFQVCQVTLKYVLVAVPGRVLFALLVALLMNVEMRGINVFRTVYYLPSIFGSSVAISVVWRFLFQNNGMINGILAALGFAPKHWLGDPNIALGTISIIPIWQFGSSMVLFLAALKNVPQELHEAATIDGCGKVRAFRRITLPMISPILLFNLIMQSVTCFQEFSTAFVLTSGKGGPNRSTLLYGIKLYREAFTDFRMGYASALSWMLFFAILVVTGIIRLTSRYWVYYGDGGDA